MDIIIYDEIIRIVNQPLQLLNIASVEINLLVKLYLKMSSWIMMMPGLT